MNTLPKINSSQCPLCGKSNLCAMEIEKTTGIAQGPCWCVDLDFSADLLSRVPASAKNQACICANCAGAGSAAQPHSLADPSDKPAA